MEGAGDINGAKCSFTVSCNQGDREYMEDFVCVSYQPSTQDGLEYLYFGVFDGHGGPDAALYAKEHLMDHIVSQNNFWSDDDELILRAIRDGFTSTHHAMWKEFKNWPTARSGLSSTAGTTASVAFIRCGKIYTGHVGDSRIVFGIQAPTTGYWKVVPLTKDHKPDDLTEKNRISKCGGEVVKKCGVSRVVRNKRQMKGKRTYIQHGPSLAMTRSLGDIWSHNSSQNDFVVSPVPDISVMEILANSLICIILGSDGLWDVLSNEDAVNIVDMAEKNNAKKRPASSNVSSSQVQNSINPAVKLVNLALNKFQQLNKRADNVSVVTFVIHPTAQMLGQEQRSKELLPGRSFRRPQVVDLLSQSQSSMVKSATLFGVSASSCINDCQCQQSSVTSFTSKEAGLHLLEKTKNSSSKRIRLTARRRRISKPSSTAIKKN